MNILTLIPANNLLAQNTEGVAEEVVAPAAEEAVANVENAAQATEEVAAQEVATVEEVAAQAPADAMAQEQPQGNPYTFWIMLAVMGVIFWFFIIRPQKKRQKEIQNFQNSLAPGAQVYTQGGIVGKVVAINEADNTLKIEVSKDVTITVFRSCVFASATPQQ